MSAADWEKYRAPLYERPPTVTPAWLTEHTAVVEAVLAEHEPFGGGAFCTCTPERDDGTREPLAIYHAAHVTAAITAALAAEAEKDGAS